MYPFLIEVETQAGLFRIPAYGTLVLLAFSFAFTLVIMRARRIGIGPEKLAPIFAAAAVFGLLGARLLYAIAVDFRETITNPGSLVACTGGLAFYGGLLGGTVGALIVAAIMNVPGWKLTDVMAPALVLGLGIGRFGCFFAGCCHGAPAPTVDPSALLPDGVLKGQLWLDRVFPFLTLEFHDGVGRLHGQLLYPTQLWSAAAALGLCVVLLVMWERRRFDGQIIAAMLMVEPILRIIIESYRADERGYVLSWAVDTVPKWLPPGFSSAGETLADGLHSGSLFIGVTTSQFIGLAMIVVGGLIWLLRRNAGVAPEEALAEEL
jgi:phosphatidylglycerol:prolipoprotein diacylglycerol transferase